MGQTCDGRSLREALRAAGRWLAQNVEGINALNVFPVPDGDTGTNMNLTMKAALEEVEAAPVSSAAVVAQALAHGALMGARGNSGVILSQIFRGFAKGLEGKSAFDGRDLADALAQASAVAYRAVIKPVEGTILTVIREASEAAQAAAEGTTEVLPVLETALEAARAALERTPELLDVLREAGVVDAGGKGLVVLLEGIWAHIKGVELQPPERVEERVEERFLEAHVPGQKGYCTNFLLKGENLDFETIRDTLLQMGDSAVIVGDERFVKVHIHTHNPGKVLDYVLQHGSLTQIKIDNMEEQEEAFAEQAAAEPTAPVAPSPTPPAVAAPVGVVAVAPGPGLAEVFRSLGCGAVVHGGQTMNPSTQELLEAIESLPQEEVILLPNNKNVLLAAQQARTLSSRRVEVVPTRTVPQGVAAMIALNFEAGLEENVGLMMEAMEDVVSGEITRAVRDSRVDGKEVREGQFLGIQDGRLAVVGDALEPVFLELVEKMGAEERELLTVFYGEEVSEEEAEALAEKVRERFPHLEVEVRYGGQPHYPYLLALE